MLYQTYTESSWGVARSLGTDRRVFFSSFGNRYSLVDRFSPLMKAAVFSYSFSLLLCLHHSVAFPQFCVTHQERVNHDVPILWSFWTSGIIFFNSCWKVSCYLPENKTTNFSSQVKQTLKNQHSTRTISLCITVKCFMTLGIKDAHIKINSVITNISPCHSL